MGNALPGDLLVHFGANQDCIRFSTMISTKFEDSFDGTLQNQQERP